MENPPLIVYTMNNVRALYLMNSININSFTYIYVCQFLDIYIYICLSYNSKTI